MLESPTANTAQAASLKKKKKRKKAESYTFPETHRDFGKALQKAAQGKCTHETHSALDTTSPDYRFIELVHVCGRCETVIDQNHLVLCKLMLSALPVWGSSPDLYRFPIAVMAAV